MLHVNHSVSWRRLISTFVAQHKATTTNTTNVNVRVRSSRSDTPGNYVTHFTYSRPSLAHSQLPYLYPSPFFKPLVGLCTVAVGMRSLFILSSRFCVLSLSVYSCASSSGHRSRSTTPLSPSSYFGDGVFRMIASLIWTYIMHPLWCLTFVLPLPIFRTESAASALQQATFVTR